MEDGGLQAILLFLDSKVVNNSEILKIETNYSCNLHNIVFSDAGFKALSNTGLSTDLGSHWLRKFASTWAKVNGCTLNETETRGRWKRNSGRRRTVDRYVKVDQPHIDAKVEAVLRVGGPFKYEVAENLGVVVPWLKGHVVPGISAFYDQYNTISDVLAVPLFWACLDPETSKKLFL
jgi:hypothetical protein